jgi:hypothetical protein
MWHPAIPATTLSERPRNFGAVLRFGNQSATQNAADGCRICPSAADRAFARYARLVAVVGAVWIGAALANLFADMRFYLGWRLLLASLRRARRTRRTLIANPMPDSTNPSTEADKPDCSL